VPELANKNKTNVINGLKLFKYRYKYFDFTKWLKDEKISNSMLSKLKSIFC